MRVDDLDKAADWLGKYASWEGRWDDFLKERTYVRQGIERPKNINPFATWWYTHRNRSIDRTTSRLEGGVNTKTKNLLRTHRGMSQDHARRAIAWLLNSLTEHPHDPWTLAKTHHNNPPPAPKITEKPIGPKTYDTALTTEEGLYPRKGWAGRWHP